jgi:hypothetical protein
VAAAASAAPPPRAGAGAEQPDAEVGERVLPDHPVGQCRHPLGEQADVEPERARAGVDLLLLRREQVGQDGREAGILELAGDVAVARAVAAAAAAVGEQDQPARPLRHHDVGPEHDARGRDLEALVDGVHGGPHTVNGSASGTSPTP